MTQKIRLVVHVNETVFAHLSPGQREDEIGFQGPEHPLTIGLLEVRCVPQDRLR